jgi:hypothetical protein
LLVNPHVTGDEEPFCCGNLLSFCQTAFSANRDLAYLSVIGMVGDSHEKNISKVFSEILNDSETVLKKGLLLYPSTRPLDKALE